MRSNVLKVDLLARVEGEGAFTATWRNGSEPDVKLRIFEPPRFFEALLQGRDFREAPDITARICGICPVAYQMSSVQAMETLCGVEVDPPIRDLRRLLYCGEWIESHVLHIYLLHAPDFLGYEDALRMAADHRGAVERGLALKKVGNDIVALLGGREIHPINVRVGGFYRAPKVDELRVLEKPLERALEQAAETVRWTAGLNFPDIERDYEYVSLRHPSEYPMGQGAIVSNRGIDCPPSGFEDHFVEEHVPHSTSLHAAVRERGEYVVGPMARFALNLDRLTPLAARLAKEAGLTTPCNNPFKSIVVRSIETVVAVEDALRIVRSYTGVERPAVPVTPRAGVGHGATEAPRGLLYHRYTLDSAGRIVNARIVPPTSQNQRSIELDVAAVIARRGDQPIEHLTWECEQAIRNYDPCISCSTHFLRLERRE